MSEAQKPEIHIEMPDGSVWAVPAHVVADNRARYYAAGEEDPEAAYETEYRFTLASDYELTDWAAGNMDWEDVAEHAYEVRRPQKPDFQEGWVNGRKRVVRP